VLRAAGLTAAGLGASALLGGCGSPAVAGLVGGSLDPGVVTFWNLFGGGDGVRLQTMLDAYKAKFGVDSLTASTFAWGDPYYTKVTLATVGDKAPNVAVAHLTRMQNLAEADLLTPITDDMLAEREYPAGTVERYPIFADRANLVGKVAKRTLIAGKLIASNAVSEADLIARGTIVQATYRTAEVEISAPVLALQAGSLNAPIQVRNVDTGKVITGIVQADGTVRVGGQ